MLNHIYEKVNWPYKTDMSEKNMFIMNKYTVKVWAWKDCIFCGKKVPRTQTIHKG